MRRYAGSPPICRRRRNEVAGSRDTPETPVVYLITVEHTTGNSEMSTARR